MSRSAGVTIGGGAPLVLIAGPCVIESEAHAVEHGARAPRHRPARRRAVRLQGVVRQGEPHVGRVVPRPGPRRRAARSSARVRERRRRAGPDRHPRAGAGGARPPRSPTSCRFRRSSRGRPTCSSPRRAPAASSTSRRDSSSRRVDMRHAIAKVTAAGNTQRVRHRARLHLRLQQPGRRHARVPDACARSATPVVFDVTHSLQLPGAGDGVTAGPGGVHRAAGVAPASPPASTACSWKCTRTRRARRATRRTRCALDRLEPLLRAAGPDPRDRRERPSRRRRRST